VVRACDFFVRACVCVRGRGCIHTANLLNGHALCFKHEKNREKERGNEGVRMREREKRERERERGMRERKIERGREKKVRERGVK
jgi:hypothetical protein